MEISWDWISYIGAYYKVVQKWGSIRKRRNFVGNSYEMWQNYVHELGSYNCTIRYSQQLYFFFIIFVFWFLWVFEWKYIFFAPIWASLAFHCFIKAFISHFSETKRKLKRELEIFCHFCTFFSKNTSRTLKS